MRLITIMLCAVTITTGAHAQIPDSAIEGAAYLEYYAKRCSSFAKLPTKTQQGLLQMRSAAGSAVMQGLIAVEEKAQKTGFPTCAMIESAFPTLIY
jgi:hypothetical protein